MLNGLRWSTKYAKIAIIQDGLFRGEVYKNIKRPKHLQWRTGSESTDRPVGGSWFGIREALRCNNVYSELDLTSLDPISPEFFLSKPSDKNFITLIVGYFSINQCQ